MAGPGQDRAWLICDEPAHGWVGGHGTRGTPTTGCRSGPRRTSDGNDQAHHRTGSGAVPGPAVQRA
ncbi:hypothetical protein [Streptomyces sp. NPDC001536]|uniref:hypothetical protein n=1 Tax=Streptomyces sp. NPDC001536 TaxID=3364583 RepID=UPI0036B32AE2